MRNLRTPRDIDADNDTDTFAEDIMSIDPETEDGDNGFYDSSETSEPMNPDNEEKDDADFNKDMLEDGSDEGSSSNYV